MIENNSWIQEASEKIKSKLKITADRNRNKIPYSSSEGVFDDWTDKNICWWTNGFWGGILNQLYHATNDEMYHTIALENEKKLDKNLMTAQGMDHDSGFKWLPTAIANYKMTGSAESKNRGITAANDLAGRFNPVGKYIRAWNDRGNGENAGVAIIDCMMNLPLLYWAYEEIHDPRFYHIAAAHADTAQKYFIREDGSVNHIVVFDASTGEFIETRGGQGCCVGSSWTRGQAWALYGFVLSYLHTKNESYLNTAKKVAHYFISNIPENGLIPVDFRQPEDCALEDSTAAAIAACGLIEIAKLLEGREKDLYMRNALKLIETLYKKRSNWDDSCDYIIEKCTAAFHDKEHEFSIIYGDYYFIEAIFKLTGEELFIW